MSMTAHLGLYEGLSEMEVGHLLAELHTGRFTGTSFDMVTVAESRQPVIAPASHLDGRSHDGA
jgi:hypothetical protein